MKTIRYLLASILMGICAISMAAPPSPSDIQTWTRQANAGNVTAQYALGYSYMKGDGVDKNRAESLKWFRMAAENGHPLSMYLVGGAYFSGDGLEKNNSESEKWMLKAANLGQKDAAKILVFFYRDGEAMPEVPKDAEKAKYWQDVIDGKQAPPEQSKSAPTNAQTVAANSSAATPSDPLNALLQAGNALRFKPASYGAAEIGLCIDKMKSLFEGDYVDTRELNNIKNRCKRSEIYWGLLDTDDRYRATGRFLAAFDRLADSIEAKSREWEKAKQLEAARLAEESRVEAEKRERYAINWRKGIKEGDYTNKGMVLEVRGNLVQVQQRMCNAYNCWSDTQFVRRDELDPPR